LKKAKATLLGSRSTSGSKRLEACLIELLETTVRRDIEIHLLESIVFSMDNMEPNAMINTMLEFNKALILGRRVGTLLQREMKDGSKVKVEEI